MRAIRVHQWGDIDSADVRLDDVPDLTPGPGEVVIDVEAVGVNPVDTYIAAGTYAIKPDLPYTPGMEAAGTILAVGDGVNDRQEGDRVWISTTTAGKLQGAYAEQVVCRAQDVYDLPTSLSFAQGAALNIAYVTAFRALIDVGRVQPNERVLIHGATGGVGLAAVQIAMAHRLDVCATGGSDAGRELLERHGVKTDQILDHHADHHLQPLEAEGVDVIVEMLANENLPADIDAIAAGGRIVVVGNRGPVEINARGLMAKQASITGMTYWSGGDAKLRRALSAVASGIDAGDLRPAIQQEFPLDRVRDAWHTVLSGNSRGKIVLVP